LPPDSIWRERGFLVYSAGNAISYMGTWAQRIGIGWLSWELTRSSTWVGCIALAQYVPLIVLGPFFGVLLDRHDRKGYGLAVNGSAAILAGALYALTALHWMNIQLLLVLAILLGIVNSAYQAARLAMVNDLVRPELLAQGIAISSILFNLSRALGPAAAGVLIAHQGVAAAFAANAISFLAILGALSIIDLRPPAGRVARKGVLVESREGFAYTAGHPRLRRFLILGAITSVLGRGGLELLPAFSAAVFNRGSTGLAQLNTAVGIGAIAGALLLSRSGTGPRLARLTRYATLALGLILTSSAQAQYPGYYPPTYPGFGPGAVLQGQASVLQAQGQASIDMETARVERQKALQAKQDTKKKAFDEMMYEKANTPSYTEEMEKNDAMLLRRIMIKPSNTEVTSGKAENIMLTAEAAGASMPGAPSPGFWDRTNCNCRSMTRCREAAATRCMPSGSTRTRAPNRRSPSSSH